MTTDQDDTVPRGQDFVEALLAELAIASPELAPALARLNLQVKPPEEILAILRANGRPEAKSAPLGMVRGDGLGYLSTELMRQTPDMIKAILAHETVHLVVERVARIADLAGAQWDGDERRANLATDRWINQILSDIGIVPQAEMERYGGIFPAKGMEQADVMEIWRAERKATKQPQSMAGCGLEGPAGDGEGQPEEKPEEAVQRHQEAHAILAGLASQSPALRKIISPPPPKARWQDVVREAAASARGLGGGVRPTPTRAKLGRRSKEEVPRPGARTKKPQLVLVVDISGSMTGLLDEVIREAEALAGMAHVHLILHDAAVLFSGQYKKGRDKISPAGGTDFVPAIVEAQRVASAWNGESVVVHLTDGCPCGEWPDVPTGLRAGFAAIFGGYEVKGPGRWRTRHVDK